MHCAYCSEKIQGKAVREGDEAFCSLECANLAAGNVPEDDEYFDEGELQGLTEEDE